MIFLQILLAATVFASSYMPNFWLFAVFYGVIFGIIAGLAYMLPVHIGFSHFPNRRGLVTGSIVAGFGCGVLISNNIVLAIINPDNLPPTIFEDNNKYFDANVADRVPEALRWLSLYFLAVGLIGALLV